MPASPHSPRVRLRIALGAGLLLLLPLAAAARPAATPPATLAEAAAAVPAYATGDAWLDARLADIDRYAARHPDAFADELERHAGVPRAYVAALLQQPGWNAGDAWFACFLGRAVEATCRSVVRARTRAGPQAGWSQVAEDFGATPGSPAWASLRLSLADSYRRWARPLQADAAMKRLLRQREAESARQTPEH